MVPWRNGARLFRASSTSSRRDNNLSSPPREAACLVCCLFFCCILFTRASSVLHLCFLAIHRATVPHRFCSFRIRLSLLLQLPPHRQLPTAMVYITSGLFGHDPAYSVHSFPEPNHTYNDMVDSPAGAGLGKRKRRTDDDTEGPSPKHISLSSTDTDRTNPGHHVSQSRPSLTAEGYIRHHAHHPAAHEPSSQRPLPRHPGSTNHERRSVKQLKRSIPRLMKAPSHLMDVEPEPTPVQRPDTHHPQSDLRSCHACGTAPKRKRDLENYLDCRKCERRTCYICARRCSGCQRDVCRECVVEVGDEGEPWCLSCYQHINT